MQKKVRIGVLGYECVAKSALTIRYIGNAFIDECLTYEPKSKKELKIQNENVSVNILDNSAADELIVKDQIGLR